MILLLFFTDLKWNVCYLYLYILRLIYGLIFCYCPVDHKVLTLIWGIYLQINNDNLKLYFFIKIDFIDNIR